MKSALLAAALAVLASMAHAQISPCTQTLSGDGDANVLGSTDAPCDEIIYGKGGADTLKGGLSHNWLDGGTGPDVIINGEGPTVDYYAAASDSYPQSDLIENFHQGADVIDVSAVCGAAGVNCTFGGETECGAGFDGVPGEWTFCWLTTHWGSNTIIRSDLDGDGHSDFVLSLSGLVPLQASDFSFANDRKPKKSPCPARSESASGC